MAMTNEEAKAIFDSAVDGAKASGDADALASAELVREYFLNPEFAERLHSYVWDATKNKLAA